MLTGTFGLGGISGISPEQATALRLKLVAEAEANCTDSCCVPVQEPKKKKVKKSKQDEKIVIGVKSATTAGTGASELTTKVSGESKSGSKGKKKSGKRRTQSAEELALIAEVDSLINEREVDSKSQIKIDKYKDSQKVGRRIPWSVEMVYAIAEIRGVEIVSIVPDAQKPQEIGLADITYICKHGTKTTFKVREFCKGQGCKQGIGCEERQNQITALIRKAFAFIGWIIPQNWKYEGTRKGIPFTCDKGHDDRGMSWYSFKNGTTCDECRNPEAASISHSFKNQQSEKHFCDLTQKERKSIISQTVKRLKKGSRQLTTEIIRHCYSLADREIESEWEWNGDRSAPIKFLCKRCGKWLEQSWASFQSGRGCRSCAGQVIETEIVRERYEAAGRFIPIDWVYKNCSTPILYYCSHCQSWWSQCWEYFQDGNGCGSCLGREVNANELVAAFEQAGRKIAEGWKYKNNRALIPYFCERCQKDCEQNWKNFSKGYNCNGCAKNTRYTDLEVQQAYEALDRILPLGWKYVNSNVPIDYFCERCQSWWRQSMTQLFGGHECGSCFAKKNPKVAALFSRSDVEKWILSRSSLTPQALREADLSPYLSESELVQLKAILSSRKGWEHTDHIVPFSLFDTSCLEQLALASKPCNLRNLHAGVNLARGNNLTVSEIVKEFRTSEIRELYNLAANTELKLAKDLPITVPVDDEAFTLWCQQSENQPSEEDVETYEDWHDLLDLLEKAPLHVYDAADLID